MSIFLAIFVKNDNIDVLCFLKTTPSKNSEVTVKEGDNKYDKSKNLTPYKEGESGNPKGRPKKVLSLVLDDLKEQGYERVSPANVQEAYEIVLGLDFMKLIEVSTNKELPALLNIVAKHLQSKERAYQVLESMLDRAHGKATQRIEQDQKIKLETDLSKLTNEQLDAIIQGGTQGEGDKDEGQ